MYAVAVAHVVLFITMYLHIDQIVGEIAEVFVEYDIV